MQPRRAATASPKRSKPPGLHLRAALTLLMMMGAVALVLVHLALAHSQQQLGEKLPFQQRHELCQAGGAVCSKAQPSRPISSPARRPASLGLLLGGADQCSSFTGPQQQQQPAPLVCAHGGSSLHPPNTAAAYESALAAGAADCVEVDALLTSDLQLVAVHDRDLRALLGQPGAQVSQYTWQQLQGLSWPGGERLLSVAQAVALVQDRVRLLIVDVKSSAAPGAKVVAQGSADSDVTEADALLAELRQLRLGANSCVWGKSDELVLRAHKAGIAGSTGYALMMRDAPAGLDQPLRLDGGPQVVAAHHAALTAPLMQALHEAGRRVFAWTVDEPGDVRRLLDLGGVAGIVTNDLVAVRRVIDQASSSTCSRQTAHTAEV